MVAYDRLNGEGFVTSRVGAGTFVGRHVPAPAERLVSFAVEGPPRPGLLVGYGAIATADIEEGLRRLRAAVTA